jgi:arabinogalactan oligomer / maltooligosaccharide transport system permease protein
MASGTRPTTAGVSRRESFLSSYRTQQLIEVWAIRVLVIAFLVVSIFPTVYVVLYSLKGGGRALYSPTFIPQVLTLDNYRNLLSGRFPTWVWNSLVIGLASGFFSTMIATFAAYAFSRMRFPGRRYGILTLLIIQMLPVNTAIVAYFRMAQFVGLLNTRIVLVLIFGIGGGALAVWLMKNFMDSIPKELDEAAFIDGATLWQNFWRVLFPLLQPMLVAQFIFGFIGVYNEYIVTTILIQDPAKYPLGVGVRTFSTQFSTNWTVFCAAAVLGSIPILIVFFLAQRLLVEGLTRGALKG